MKIIGIDLAGSEKKETGFAVLDSKLNCKTEVLHSDKEIVDAVLSGKSKLVTIDAPLGLPSGRCCLDYNCKCNNPKRYSRECEKELRAMGIRVFPCGFAGMRMLTARGIQFKRYFEKKGYDVIETYPGSAQDVLKIPRKGKDHRKLQRALIKYGINGDVTKKDITDHELDAITSALVGLFYLRKKYVALGIPKESQIIIPRC